MENRQYLFSFNILTAFFMHRKTLRQVEVFILSAFWSVITESDSNIEVCVWLDHWSSSWHHRVTSHSLSINSIFTDKNKMTWHFPALLVAFSSKTKIYRSVDIQGAEFINESIKGTINILLDNIHDKHWEKTSFWLRNLI